MESLIRGCSHGDAQLAAVQVNAELYGTTRCHLCEQAQEILRQAGIAAIHIDIVEDEKLLDRYSLRIPVLKRVDNDAELDWPFDADAVLDFLGQTGSRSGGG